MPWPAALRDLPQDYFSKYPTYAVVTEKTYKKVLLDKINLMTDPEWEQVVGQRKAKYVSLAADIYPHRFGRFIEASVYKPKDIAHLCLKCLSKQDSDFFVCSYCLRAVHRKCLEKAGNEYEMTLYSLDPVGCSENSTAEALPAATN